MKSKTQYVYAVKYTDKRDGKRKIWSKVLYRAMANNIVDRLKRESFAKNVNVVKVKDS